MKKSLTHLLLVLLLTTTGAMAFAQDSKNVSVKNFNSLSVSSGIDVYLNQGSSESLTIKGDAEIIKNVIVEQKGNSLIIRMEPTNKLTKMFSNSNKSIKVYLNFKSLNEINSSGGSDIVSENQIKTDRLSIRSSGGSDVKLNIVCNELSIQSSGGSDLDLKGKAENMVIQSSGGSDINAYQLMTEYAKVSSSGGSDVYINVNKGLEASASGGSDIRYKGQAALKRNSNSKKDNITRVN